MTNAELERVDASTVAEAVRAGNKEIAVVDVRNSEVSIARDLLAIQAHGKY
jgi:hypothetical protein